MRLLLIGVALAAVVLGLESVGGIGAVLLAAPVLSVFSLLLGGWYVGEEAIHRIRRSRAAGTPSRAGAPRHSLHLRVPLRQGPHLGSVQRRGPPAAVAAP